MIYWVRTLLVCDPEGVFLVVSQVFLSLLREDDTLEYLGIDYPEILDLWTIANSSVDKAECRLRLAEYYRPKSQEQIPNSAA
ncbi:hypothetical protein C0580_00225 [Candidatus Parcubacteria bacterium]|nr:MAG: hypothetical protein C0580_00225 [Candidatus Parcubacteria bacterium]